MLQWFIRFPEKLQCRNIMDQKLVSHLHCLQIDSAHPSKLITQVVNVRIERLRMG